MDFSAIDWREAIMIAVAIASVYLLVVLLRLVRIHRRRGEPVAPAAEPTAWVQAPAQFGEHLLRSGIEAELQQLRVEVAALREELAQLKAARRVSPQYNEAMLLAQRGMRPHDIADQCGISVGEAELVLALSRNKQEYDDYGKHEDPGSAAG